MGSRMALMLMTISIVANTAFAAVPVTVTAGRLDRIDRMPSRFVEPRNVDVWLPPHYDKSRRYSVLYMHDGQSLFDGSMSLSKHSWGVAETVARLLREEKIDDFIVVGIWNSGNHRHSEYFPQKALEYMPLALRTTFTQTMLDGKPRGNDYLKFIVEELKPAIDRAYSTRPDRANTWIMGSSMGGISSLYAITEYPGVFGAAACLSTHWIGTLDDNAGIPLATFRYLDEHLPDPATHRIYMDHGTVGLDAFYGTHQAFVDILMREKGFTDAVYESRVFAGAAHDELAWSQRLAAPLMFLAGRSNR